MGLVGLAVDLAWVRKCPKEQTSAFVELTQPCSQAGQMHVSARFCQKHFPSRRFARKSLGGAWVPYLECQIFGLIKGSSCLLVLRLGHIRVWLEPKICRYCISACTGLRYGIVSHRLSPVCLPRSATGQAAEPLQDHQEAPCRL